MGYAGGKKDAPTYANMGDHTETVQVDYDPSRISYSQLLDFFWQSHQPRRGSLSRQYMNAVFYHNEDQRLQAEDSKVVLEQSLGNKVKSKVVPLRSFTRAEDYHQKYNLKKHKGLLDELVRMYPSHRDFVDSTATSRLNGYAGGYGSTDQMSGEIENLGMSTRGREALVGLVR